VEPPFDRTLREELLYRDPIVVAVRRDHPFAGKDVAFSALAGERLVLSDRHVTPGLFDSIVAMCAKAGFSPQIVNTSETWSGILTLIESGEGVALVPAGVRHLQTKGLAFSRLLPDELSLGVSVVWNPANQGPALHDFLTLLRENKERIGRTGR